MVRWFLIIASAVPFAYIWTIPLLHNYLDFGHPGNIGADGGNNKTLSGFISSTEGTGAMAASFFWPILFMWHGPSHKINNKFSGISFYTIFFFQLFFGLFLTMSTTYNGSIHGLAVVGFALAGIAKLSNGLYRGVKDDRATCVLVTAIIALGLVVLLA